ncbi:MAG: GNAT family N-acetyltransferase [Planctomycetota bacterium]
MELDLTQCEIRTPTGDALLSLYRLVIDAFPADRPVFTEMIEKGRRFYTWTPYALYRGEELLGNVSLVPVKMWLGGRRADVVGIASVATRREHRRKGIARHLMRYALGIVDEQLAPAVLFTDLPKLYEGLGFQRIEQTYPAASVREMDFTTSGFACELVDKLDRSHLESMAEIHAHDYPDYDGKVVRDPDYWQLYQMLFNPFPRLRLLFSTRQGRIAGYARVEVEPDRLLVSELCGRADATDAAEALLGFVAEYAREVQRDSVTFALPSDHFAGQILERRRVALEPEPPGAHRETFMVRPPAGEGLGALGALQWSLADKF